MSDWDPIGVSGIPEAVDEYDAYIPNVHKLLTERASLDEIQNYLFVVVSERMGMSPPATRNDMRRAAESLKRIEAEV